METQILDKGFEEAAISEMDTLYTYAYRMTGNLDDADILLRETYARAPFHSLKGETPAAINRRRLKS